MINTIIFDIGRVLISFDWEAHLKSLGASPEEVLAVGKAMFDHKDWAELDRGVLTEEEVLARFISHAPQHGELMKKALGTIYRTITPFDYAKPWISRLKEQGYRILYLSNYGEIAREQSRKALDFTELMDGGIFSFEVKMIKPNPWIYGELIKRYSIVPQEAVFLDDSAPNIEAAKTMGLHGILFTSYQEAVMELKKLGVEA